MRIQLIGGLAVVCSEQEVTRFPTHRSRLLLAYLAYFRKQAHPRELLAEMLWPGGNPDAIRLRLNQTVAELRRALGRPDGFLVSDRFTIRLDPGVSTDVQDFSDKVRAARHRENSGAKAGALAEAVDEIHGDLLPGFYEDWVLEARDEWLEALQGALRELSELLANVGRWPEAISFGKRAVAANLYAEDSHATLLRVLLQAGRQSEAIQHYESLKARLREDFAVGPCEEIVELMRSLENAPHGPMRTQSNTPGPEPTPPTRTNPPALTTEPALETYILIGDAERAMRLAAVLVQHWNLSGELHVAYRWLKRILSLPHAMHAPPDARATALVGLGVAATSMGRFEEARAAFQGSLSLSTLLGDQKLIGESRRGLGGLALRHGKHQDGQAHYVKSLEAFKRLGDKSGVADALTGIGESMRYLGDLTAAEGANIEAQRLRLEIGRKDRAAQSALNLGIIASRQGAHSRALRCLRNCLETMRGLGSPTVTADCLMEIAGVCSERGEPQRAACLLAAASRLRELIKAPIPSADRAAYVGFLQIARRSISRDEFNRQWRTGQTQSLEASIDLALRCGLIGE